MLSESFGFFSPFGRKKTQIYFSKKEEFEISILTPIPIY